jgi:hypothetical protein
MSCATLVEMKWIGGVVAVVGVVGVLGAGTAGASGKLSCASGFTESRGASQITVSGDSCANARAVAERTVAVAPAGCVKVVSRTKGTLSFRKPCTQLSYKCTAVTTNQRRALKVTCVRGARQIRFRY